MRLIASLLVSLCLLKYSTAKPPEQELINYIKNTYEKVATEWCYKVNDAEFAYETDINNTTKLELTTNATLENAAVDKQIWEEHFKGISPDDYEDPWLKRQLRSLTILGNAALDTEKLAQLTDTTNEMTGIYSTGKICPYKKQKCNLEEEGLTLEPGIEEIMSNSRDYDELVYAWKAWRDVTGAKMKTLYKTYVDLSNEAAEANNFQDKGDLWRYAYEDDNFIQNMDELWAQIEPFYLELHTYVAAKLKALYGDKLDLKDGLLPAHILGNMWAQEWEDIASLVRPYPNVSQVDVTAEMQAQNWQILDLFHTADEFYQSLGLLPNGMCYDESLGAMIQKPEDGRDVLCHASAWDFCDAKTFRLKMCTNVDFDDFVTIHHEMGHIQYYQQYENQSIVFRDGANPGFHEAIGDTIALSVSTPKHLVKIGLLTNYTESEEADLNTLMDMALSKVAFLPFGLLIDKWRWDVFAGVVPEDKWNSHWWDLRQKYQKIKAPIPRSDQTDLDAAAKFHVAGDSQYIAYFVAGIVQFQFYKSLCMAAGQYDPQDPSSPLYKCDYYQSKEAGDLLRSGLSLGSSVHWSDTLELLTGERQLNASAILEYFQPLYEFLKEQNHHNLNRRQQYVR